MGTRLWPLSRKSYPKQFSLRIAGKSLFQSSAQRLLSSKIVDFKPHITLTNSDFRFIITEQLLEVGIDPGPILIEPEAKNTAASILAASLFAVLSDKDAILLVAPSDHVIPDNNSFHEAILSGLYHVQNSKVVTFGIKPTHPETGYGYLELSLDNYYPNETADVIKFIEKPDIVNAKKMIANANFLWNSGIFLFAAKDMIEAFRTYAPKTLALVSNAVNQGTQDLGFLRLSSDYWSKLDSISIDYAIMEKVENLVAVPFTSKWSDLGGWDAVWQESPQDVSGNVTSKLSHAFECSDTLLRSESAEQLVVGIGLDSIMVIAMSDAILVTHKDYVQDVKKVVEFLKTKNITQADISSKNYRPWGWFESKINGVGFQVKRIHVNPGASLSLQSHKHRSEHWVVVEGTSKVTINNKIKLLSRGEAIHIPVGAKHRIQNTGKKPNVIIEVQIGDYLGEDDIIRFEDIYNRN